MAMKKAQLFPRLVDAEAEARFCAAVNARIEENLDDPLPDVDDEEVQASIDSIIWRAEARYSGDHLTNEFETAAQEAAYNGWLRAEVQASRAEGGPYVEVRPTRTMLSIHALNCAGGPKLYMGTPATMMSAASSSSTSSSLVRSASRIHGSRWVSGVKAA